MTAIKPDELFTLPSGEMIKVTVPVVGTKDDWNCVYRGRLYGVQITLSGSFIRRWAKKY